jgi:two-component system chemotaxis response regulator CheY
MTSRNKMILLVEDNETTRAAYAAYLRHAGYSVREAGDGAEGLEAARGSTPDLILTDIRMPEMDGIEMAEVLRSDGVPNEIPIVAVTAEELDGRRGAEADELFHSILAKPVALTRLRDHVRKIVGEP